MKNIINTSELQRRGLKDIYETIENYGEAFIINQRSKKTLKIVDSENKHLLINIIKSLKSVKDELKEKFDIERLGIFGSFANGSNSPESDLDLIVDFKYKNLKELFVIEDILIKATGIKNIDLLTSSKINSFAKATMEKEVIYV